MPQVFVRSFTYETFTPAVAEWLKQHVMYDAAQLTANSELLKIYDSVIEASEKQFARKVTHLWVLCQDDLPVGLALREHYHEHALYLFVEEGCRRRGYGRRLLNLALATKPPFGVFYTASSEHLYRQYRLVDLGGMDS